MKRHFCAVWRQAEKSKILVGRIRVNGIKFFTNIQPDLIDILSLVFITLASVPQINVSFGQKTSFLAVLQLCNYFKCTLEIL